MIYRKENLLDCNTAVGFVYYYGYEMKYLTLK